MSFILSSSLSSHPHLFVFWISLLVNGATHLSSPGRILESFLTPSSTAVDLRHQVSLVSPLSFLWTELLSTPALGFSSSRLSLRSLSDTGFPGSALFPVLPEWFVTLLLKMTIYEFLVVLGWNTCCEAASPFYLSDETFSLVSGCDSAVRKILNIGWEECREAGLSAACGHVCAVQQHTRDPCWSCLHSSGKELPAVHFWMPSSHGVPPSAAAFPGPPAARSPAHPFPIPPSLELSLPNNPCSISPRSYLMIIPLFILLYNYSRVSSILTWNCLAQVAPGRHVYCCWHVQLCKEFLLDWCLWSSPFFLSWWFFVFIFYQNHQIQAHLWVKTVVPLKVGVIKR